MKISNLLIVLAAASLLAAAGCNNDEPTLTKAQEDAARHPTANPSYQGHAPGSDQKMAESIDAYRKRHQNDKVEFTK
ncbi:MAG TPA: hypothetical protein VG944_01260 [Fimbriimonas sp.]|nr:hypothetical protein [Fimbriimonas sp.]